MTKEQKSIIRRALSNAKKNIEDCEFYYPGIKDEHKRPMAILRMDTAMAAFEEMGREMRDALGIIPRK